ncbi:MAG TPA: HlyD family efflux transporter periplasmic adaptor subunit [Chitinophagales bacterium]|nr:HlyD family efflux transporter periplasmic adaptor subunit [Chitinophagales bacterium]
MKRKYLFFAIPVLALFASCNNGNSDFDAAGSFESVETIVSTEASGTIMQFNVEEGQTLNAGQQVGFIDTTQLYLRKKQLQAQIAATLSQRPDIPVQIASLEEQLNQAQINQKRAENLLRANAGTQQQLDNANSQVQVIQKQIDALQSSLSITSSSLASQVTPLERQIEQVNDQLYKCRIINPIHGVVLTKYAEYHEIAMPGKALYKIAEMDTLTLRAYVDGAQYSQMKLGQKVNIRIDKGAKDYRNYTGTIYWISDKSEFTPKTIPTKDERADLVYAIKIRVVNDGYLKIGMYGEVKF